MNLNDLEEVLRTLTIGIKYDYKQSQPLQPKLHFLWEPLPWFCIDCPNVGDCLVYKVSTNVHPWGIQMISCIPALKNATYQDYIFCVRRQEWAFHTYFSLAD